jgi:hypothetical protein
MWWQGRQLPNVFVCVSLPRPLSLALFLVFLAAVLVLSLATGNIQIHAPERQFLPIYLLRPNQAPRKYTTSLLVQNSSGTSANQSGNTPPVYWSRTHQVSPYSLLYCELILLNTVFSSHHYSSEILCSLSSSSQAVEFLAASVHRI